MLQDLRFALRFLARRRAFALSAILMVGLGVGMNTAIFSIADSVLFRPLPYPDVERLFMLRRATLTTGAVYGRLPPEDLEAARQTGLFDAIAVPAGFSERVYVREERGLGTMSLGMVPREYTELLGVRPVIGRSFVPEDANTRAVLLSHRTWMRRFGGNPGVVDSTIQTTGEPLRIVGVLPAGFRNPTFAGEDGLILLTGTLEGSAPLVHLKPGVAHRAAEAQLNALPIEGVKPGVSGFRLVPLREEMAGRQEGLLWLLLAAAAIVLLVACVNLANLILVQGSARGRELAVRAAIGGSPARLIRMLLSESLCLGAAGAIAGVFVAYFAFPLLVAQLPPVLLRVTDPMLDIRALLFAMLCALAATCAFGVVPAWRLSRVDARKGLQLGRMQMHAPRRGRQVLVAIEVGICLALVTGAALVGRSLLALLQEDLGFGTHRVVANFDLPTALIRTARETRVDLAARMQFTQARLQDLRALPGVRAAGVVSAVPFSGAAPDRLLFGRGDARKGGVYSASAGAFSALGVPFVAGRDFTDAESFSGAPVAILNERAARLICGSEPCLGRAVSPPGLPPQTVVGIVHDARQSFRTPIEAAMFVPFDAPRFRLAYVVADADDTPAAREGLKRALSVAPDALIQVRALDALLDNEVSPYRFNAVVIGAFSLLTLVLAALGVYGVMAAVVTERTREFGIRLALGATRARMNRHVLSRAALPIAAGIAGGLLLAIWSSRYVLSLLYGVTRLDSTSYAVAVAIVSAAALLAAYVPARRAARVDPIVALRSE